MSKLVVVAGIEFDKLSFYTTVSATCVMLIALVIQLSRSRRRWKRIALQTQTAGPSRPLRTVTPRSTVVILASSAVFLYAITFNLGQAFERSSRTINGGTGEEKIIYACFTLLAVLALTFGLQLQYPRDTSTHRDNIDEVPNQRNEPLSVTKLDVVVVGVGPRSAGYFHLMQFLDMHNVTVTAVVEPYLLGTSNNPPPSFVDLVSMLLSMDIQCCRSIQQLEQFKAPTLCLIAAKTRDNPKHFQEAILKGASSIYLESPGAQSVEQLSHMKQMAEARGVQVFIGYQRLCCRYVQKAISLSRSIRKSHIFFCHNQPNQSIHLPSVVDRNPEGLLHTTALQELAIVVKLLDIRADSIKTFKVNSNRLFSEKETFQINDGGEIISDYTRVAFKLSTENGRSVSILVDRCGGLVSFSVVKSPMGQEIQRFHSRDEVATLEDELKYESDMIDKQFVIERDELFELKKIVVEDVLNGGKAENVLLVSIEDGIEIMKLADYCALEIDSVLQ